MNKSEQEKGQGTQEIFTTLYTTYYKSIATYINRRIHNYEVAQDMTQDVFLRMYRQLDHLTVDYRIKSYLFTIASHMVYDYCTRKSYDFVNDTHLEMQEQGHDAYIVPDVAESSIESMAVYNALMSIPVPERTTFYNAVVGGYSQSILSKSQGISTRQVRNHLATARKMFRATYSQEQETA